jgi:putative transcriptional regulator
MPRRYLFVLCIALIAAASAVQARSPAAAAANSVLLIAKPAIVDPNFSHTVVLVTRTPDDGTVGVILNRPSPIPVRDVLPPELPSGNYHDKLYLGGPVLGQVVIALFHADRPPRAPAFHVLRNVYLSMHPDNIRMLLGKERARYRLFLGFSGWAPEQLKAELMAGGWYVLPAKEAILFRSDTSGMWQELFDRASSPQVSGPAHAAPSAQAAALDWALSNTILPPR